MLKKIIVGLMILSATSLFAMSLNKLNSASKTELMEINGIGDAKATAIIKERKKGKFKSFEDFQRVDGVGEATAKNVKNDVKTSSKQKSTSKHTKKSSAKSKKKS
jgi:competence protein ComEA